MRETPDIDGRDAAAIEAHIDRIAPYYTTDWDPDADGPGATLATLFAGMAGEVTERLDRVPEALQTAFVDELGFDRMPPQPAKLPLSVAVADGAGRNVVVPAGTRAVAEATESRPEQRFELADGDTFEATPANLDAVYGVDPPTDGVYDHWSPGGAAGLEAGAEVTLFSGSSEQRHALYVGHADQLAVGGGDDGSVATVRVRLTTDAPRSLVAGALVWQFYGESTTADGEPVERWHTVPGYGPGEHVSAGGQSGSADETVVVDLPIDGTLTETTVGGVESLWIRALAPVRVEPREPVDVALAPTVGVGPGPRLDRSETSTAADDGPEEGETSDAAHTLAPDRLLYNDVPLPYGDDAGSGTDSSGTETGGPYNPLGPAPVARDTFYVASSEAFTKAETRVELTFAGLSGSVQTGSTTGSSELEPELSWEYWDGDGWSKLPGLVDDTDRLTGGDGSTAKNTVRFRVPPDLAATTVAGHESHWVRARVVGGEYGERTATETPDSNGSDWETNHIVDPPAFQRLDISYLPPASPGDGDEPSNGDGAEPPDGEEPFFPSAPATHVFAENNLATGANLAQVERARIRPFEAVPDERQTLYFGFDAPLHGGPVTLFVDVGDTAFPESFHTRVVWEYCETPPGESESGSPEWVRLDATDGTEGLTEQGIVSLVFAGETSPCRLFGTERHWVRARLAGDEFQTVPDGPGSAGTASSAREAASRGVVLTPDGQQYGRVYVEGRTEYLQLSYDLGGDGTEGSAAAQGTVLYDVADLAEWSPSYTGAPGTGDPSEVRSDGGEPAEGSSGLRDTAGTTRTRSGTVLTAGSDHTVETIAADVGSTRLAGEATSRAVLEAASTVDTGADTSTVDPESETSAFDVGGGESNAVPRDATTGEVAFEADDPGTGEPSRPTEGLTVSNVGTEVTVSGPAAEYRVFGSGTHAGVSDPGRNYTVSAGGRGDHVFEVDSSAVGSGSRQVSVVRSHPELSASRGHVVVVHREYRDPCAEPAPEPCGRRLETEPPSGEPSREPPKVGPVATNAGWAYNVHSVSDKPLGSGDGSQSQTFAVSSPPVIDETVWVDELDTLSEGRRAALRAADEPSVEPVEGPQGGLAAFWVAWTGVADFFDSGPDDRHYVLDRTAGTVTFGDGEDGATVPPGQDNVRISYRTGGGPDGNVEAGAVTELVSSLQFVDGLTNPVAGAGGAAAESTDSVVSRAPGEIRDRNRAVAAVDYERIALDAARGLARVRCLPGLDRAGEHAPGWVTLLVVPSAPRERPMPSPSLRAQVSAAVGDQAPATVTANDRLVVRGPSYVRVSVEATLVSEGTGSLATLEETVRDRLDAYLHPLTGREDGSGWAFGALPERSDLYALLENVAGVDHVSDLVVRFRATDAGDGGSSGGGPGSGPTTGGDARTTGSTGGGPGGSVTVLEGEEAPEVGPDVLVHSGTHELRVVLDGASTGGS